MVSCTFSNRSTLRALNAKPCPSSHRRPPIAHSVPPRTWRGVNDSRKISVEIQHLRFAFRTGTSGDVYVSMDSGSCDDLKEPDSPNQSRAVAENAIISAARKHTHQVLNLRGNFTQVVDEPTPERDGVSLWRDKGQCFVSKLPSLINSDHATETSRATFGT